MKLLAVSDSHGNTDALRRIFERENDADMLIHLGDGAADMARFLPFTAGRSVVSVLGNCDDRALGLKEAQTFSVAGTTVFACHGHRFGVKKSLLNLYYEGKSRNAALCLYGHTHVAAADETDGVLLLNPGAAYFGRYALLSVDEAGIRYVFKTVS